MWAWHDTTWMWLMMIAYWSLMATLAYLMIRALQAAGREETERPPAVAYVRDDEEPARTAAVDRRTR